MGLHIQVPHFTSNISSDRATIAWTIDEEITISNTRTRILSSRPHCNLLCIYNQICQLYDTENLVLTPRRLEDEEQLDFDRKPLTFIVQKPRKIPQARGDSLLQLKENLETLIRRASEQAELARKVEVGQLFITNESVMMETAPLLDAENTQVQGIHPVKIGPVTGIKAIESAGTLVLQVQVL